MGNNSREDMRFAKEEIPEKWQQAVKRPDGKDKPVVMYFTDFSLLYTDGEKMLAKIRDVLKVFEENRENVVMLWHQDPQLMKNLPVMKPALWEEYKKLTEAFEEGGYGIYDDTSESDEAYFEEIRRNYPGPAPTPGERRAIAFSSAFYGDGGYISNCFRNEGKPVMIQAPDILSGRD